MVKASAPKLASASSLLDSGSDVFLPLGWAPIHPFLYLASPSRQSDCSPVGAESSWYEHSEPLRAQLALRQPCLSASRSPSLVSPNARMLGCKRLMGLIRSAVPGPSSIRMPLSLTRLASPHHTSRDASYSSRTPCGSADGISVAVAVVGSPRIPSIRRTPLGVALELTIGAACSHTQRRRRCVLFMRWVVLSV